MRGHFVHLRGHPTDIWQVHQDVVAKRHIESVDEYDEVVGLYSHGRPIVRSVVFRRGQVYCRHHHPPQLCHSRFVQSLLFPDALCMTPNGDPRHLRYMATAVVEEVIGLEKVERRQVLRNETSACWRLGMRSPKAMRQLGDRDHLAKLSSPLWRRLEGSIIPVRIIWARR